MRVVFNLGDWMSGLVSGLQNRLRGFESPIALYFLIINIMIQCLNPFGKPEIVYLPLELSEVTKTIGNFDNVKLVNSKYYGTTLNYTYNTFLVTK